MQKLLKSGLAAFVVCLSAQPAFAQAYGAKASNANATTGTAACGYSGSINTPSSDYFPTYNNNPSDFLVQPPDNTHTSPTRQSSYSAITQQLPTQSGLLAPASTMQYGDSRSFAYIWDCGFPAPQGAPSLGGGAYVDGPVIGGAFVDGPVLDGAFGFTGAGSFAPGGSIVSGALNVGAQGVTGAIGGIVNTGSGAFAGGIGVAADGTVGGNVGGVVGTSFGSVGVDVDF